MDREYYEYEAKVRKLKQIIEQLSTVFNMSEYEKELQNIEDEINEVLNSKIEKNPSYGICNSKLNDIIDFINEKLQIFYEIYLLSNQINSLLDNMTEDNYEKVVVLTKNLINNLLKVDMTKRDDCLKIINDSYRTIYDVIVNERAINREEIINYVLAEGDNIIKNNVGILVKEDIKKLHPTDRNDIELNYINNGIGFNFLCKDVIEKICINNKFEKRTDYDGRKRTATMELLGKIDDVDNYKTNIEKQKEDRLKIVRKSKLTRAGLRAKMSLIFLSPVILSLLLGYGGSFFCPYRRVDERTYNKVTKEVISESSNYETKSPLYQVVVKSYGPWQENTEGDGYIRNIIEWNYTNNESTESVDPDDIVKMFDKDKKTYTETKAILNESDKKTEPRITVTEYITDKQDTRPHAFPTIGFGFVGSLIVLLIIACYYDNKHINIDRNKLREIKDKLESMIDRKFIKRSFVTLGDKRVMLEEEIKNVENKYGDITSEITEEQVEKVKKYLNK
jgi:hypothetical protein